MFVESERTDVAVGILFLLVQTLLELTVFLEAVLFGHLTFLVFGLHYAALATELVHLAVEHYVLAELAFQ